MTTPSPFHSNFKDWLIELQVDKAIDYIETIASKTPVKEPKVTVKENPKELFVHRILGLPPLPGVKRKDVVVGIEYEIENVGSIDFHLIDEFFTITEDHSLKFYGKEFITRPNTIDNHISWYKILRDAIKPQDSSKDAWGECTSTHVHLNVQLLTEKELQFLLCLYILLEDVFFKQCKPHRKHNIHCVPLHYTNIAAIFSGAISLKKLCNRWHKYSALNLVPMLTQGTVEFRHMHGMDDVKTLERWLRLIDILYSSVLTGATVQDLAKALYQGLSYRQILSTFMVSNLEEMFPISEEDFRETGISLKLLLKGTV